MEARVAQQAPVLRFSHDKAGLGVEERLGEHGLTPGGGEAFPLQLRDLTDMTAVHRHDGIFHNNSFFQDFLIISALSFPLQSGTMDGQSVCCPLDYIRTDSL